MAENRPTINHFLRRAAKDLGRLKSEAERIGGNELSLLASLIDAALAEALEEQNRDPIRMNEKDGEPTD